MPSEQQSSYENGKNEFAEAYRREFEGRENLQEIINEQEPIERKEGQTKLEDYTEGGKFGEKIERDKATMQQARQEKEERIKQGLKEELAVKLGIEVGRLYTADKYPEEVRENIEEASKIIVPRKRKEFIKSASRVQPTPQEIKEMSLKEVGKIKDDFIRMGLSSEEVDEIYNKVKMEIESGYK